MDCRVFLFNTDCSNKGILEAIQIQNGACRQDWGTISENVVQLQVFRDKYQDLIRNLEDHINTVEMVDSMAAVNAAFERNKELVQKIYYLMLQYS